MKSHIVITGPPGSGKTTLLLELSKLGFQVMPESYRWLKVIQLLENPGVLNSSSLDDESFRFHIALQAFIDDEEILDNGLIFSDRSFVDIWAYCQAYSQKARGELAYRFAKKATNRIACAVLLPPRNSITTDWLRKEDSNEAIRLYEHIKLAYNAMGIKLITMEHSNPSIMAERTLVAISKLI